jgi:hypothetical protein
MAALEGASMQLYSALQSAGLLAVRLRQIQRRAPGLLDILRPADEEIARLVDACDRAHQLIAGQLAADQATRSERDPGRKGEA